ncbi:MAG: type II toxin-antitoxin system YafQ family toxin [Oscillospiraceae bacterium]|nr:type II toxin-antitoxin system YafQ family toxin [Oscillospiraceae bacterium]
MLDIQFTAQMKRSVKKMQKRGKNINKLTQVLALLAVREVLPPKYKDHQLKGNMKDCRECHIEPNWLLKYQIHEDVLILLCVDTGTHDDLFKE